MDVVHTLEPPRTKPRALRCLPVTALLAFIISVHPLLIWYGRRVSDGSDEPLGVIALIAALATLAVAACYGKRDRDRIRIHPGRMMVGAGMLAGIQFGGLVNYPLLVGLLAVGAIALSVSMPRGKAGVIVLLVLSLPLMASLDFFAGYPLRLAAAEITVNLLKISGIEVERTGVMLIDGEHLVGIDPPCAGIRMLWTACFVAAVLAARMRLSWLRTSGLLAIAVGCVVVGNGVRAALVFLPESGRVEWPEWAHPAAGLLVHGCVLATVFGSASRLDLLGRRCDGTRSWRKMRQLAVIGLLLVVLGLGMVANGIARGRSSPSPSSSVWPTMLEGTPLVPLALSPMEESFARSFPGDIAKFTWGDAEIIMRRTHQATRMMHPSGDCLRAAGFETQSKPVFRDADERLWGASTAVRDGHRWLVHERYVSTTGDARTDASAWYWQALLHPELGPWTAVTVIRPELQAEPRNLRTGTFD